MTKFVIISLLLTFAVSVLHGKSNWGKFFNEGRVNERRDTGDYASACKKQENTICKKKTTDDCQRNKNVPIQCPRLCGICAPFTGVCPTEYKFGCCWNGQESVTVDKSDCPDCKDMNENICKREAIKNDCDLSPNTPRTRVLCPETCGACNDYGNLENNSV